MSSAFEKKQARHEAERAAPPKRDEAARSSGAIADLLRLHQLIGNRAVGRLLQPEAARQKADDLGEGRALPAAVRSLFEERFGEDFSRVRVHTGGRAKESTRAFNAVAYTVGNDVVFDAGKYDPGSAQGQTLLAHELAHVVQQSRGGDAPSTFDTSSGLEQGADRAAAQFSSGAGPVTVAGASSPGVARQDHSGDIVWIGEAPLSVRLAQRRKEQQEFEELKKGNPFALPPPARRPGGLILSAEDVLGFDPLRQVDDGPLSEFEKKLDAKQPFVHTIGKGGYRIRDGDVMRIRDKASGEISHYNFRAGETLFTLDREGRVLVSSGLEAPLETPVIDPIDVIFFVADVGPLVAKGLAAGGKELFSLAAKGVIRQTEETVASGAFRRTASEVAQDLTRKYAGRLVDSNDALAGIIGRARHPSLRVDGRAAANELRGIISLLEDGLGGRAVARVEVVPATSAGRTPDLIVHFVDGSTTRYEMRALTSAPRGYVTPKADLGRGALARSLAEQTAQRPVSESQIAQAILDKAKDTPLRPSQLTSLVPGVGPGGTIAVNITTATTNSAVVDGAVQRVASRLGPHVERIDVSFLMPRAVPSDPLTRGILSYIRQPNGAYFRVP